MPAALITAMVVVIAAVLIYVSDISTPVTSTESPVTAKVLSEISNVPDSVTNKVNTGGVSNFLVPIKGANMLTSDSKPEFLYIGAGYCPYCGAERWAIIVALSRFGSFSKLKLQSRQRHRHLQLLIHQHQHLLLLIHLHLQLLPLQRRQ